MMDTSFNCENGGSYTTINTPVNGALPSEHQVESPIVPSKPHKRNYSDEPIKPQVDVRGVANIAHKRTYSAEPSKLLVGVANVMGISHKRTFSSGSEMLANLAHRRTYSSGCEIDTAAPIESVKEAVNKFGGIIDWKAHKIQTDEKRKYVEAELEKAQEEIRNYKKQSEAANDAKENALNELDSTKRLIEEVKLNLERAQTEEQQAKQDSELAKLRVEEVQQGVADEASVASNAELEVAQTRHAEAVAELKSVKDELEKLQVEYSSLIEEKDLAVARVDEAASASTELEKTVEALTIELIAVKGSLEAAHVAHLDAEEQRIRAHIAKVQDCSKWEEELKKAEEELGKLNQECLSKDEVKMKLDHATTLLIDLKAELEACERGKPNQEKSDEEDKLKANQEPICKEELGSHKQSTTVNKELEELRQNIERATTKVNYLKVAFVSLESEFETENLAVSNIKQREGIALVTVASLEADLKKIMSELELIYMEKENMIEVPDQLDEAKQETEQSKSLSRLADEEMCRAKKEAELVKVIAFTIDRKLHAAQKEIEAAQASERLALAAAKALEQSEVVGNDSNENAPKGVTLSLEEYQALSKRACDVEEEARLKVAAAISQLEEAKESELKSLERLEEVNRGNAAKKQELRIAIEKAEQAMEGKLASEQELRNRRTENEQRRRASDAGQRLSNLIISSSTRNNNMEEIIRLERSVTAPVQTNPDGLLMLRNGMETDSSSEAEMSRKKKKKRSLFPRIVMFLARRKAQAPKAM